MLTYRTVPKLQMLWESKSLPDDVVHVGVGDTSAVLASQCVDVNGVAQNLKEKEQE